jgi:hypothetical protein
MEFPAGLARVDVAALVFADSVFDFTFKPGKLDRLPMRLSVMPSLR